MFLHAIHDRLYEPTKSSPHASILLAMYFVLTSALHKRWTPSTPAVNFRPSPRPSPAPSAPGTARMKLDDNVSNASRDEDIRAWYDSSNGSCTTMRNRVRRE